MALVFFCCSAFLLGAGIVSAADAKTPPGEVTYLRCVKAGDRSATVRWQDPADTDLATIEIT
jgi:hypothetical protein